MTAVKPLAVALETFVILLVTFLLHRAFAYPLLFGAVEFGHPESFKALAVGAMSDVWVAYLWAVLVSLIYASLTFLGFTSAARVTWLGILLVGGAAAASHVAYIEFFRFQVIPFHLRYLLDPEFVSANGGSLFTARSAATFGGFVVTGLLVLWLDLFNRQAAAKLPVMMGVLTVLALLAHNRNLHYKMQWFIPENLQVNGFERLYLHLKHAEVPTPLTVEELSRLAAETKGEKNVAEVTPESLFRTLSKPVPEADALAPEAAAMRAGFDEALAAGAKPRILILLLESLRPAETGYFAPDKPSLTPNLDALAGAGFPFLRAFSTGSVTRGAQEAVLCGYRGARDTSMMRGVGIVKVPCLPQALAHRQDKPARTLWLHGGEGRFDGQLDFWRDRGMTELLSLKDFPADAPRTGWGVGDQTFLGEALARLDRAEQSDGSFLFALLLTVTNHIPWDLPADAPEGVANGSYAHPSYRTTAYADQAVGRFVHELKRSGAWDRTLLVVVSDHGNGLPPASDLYRDDPKRDDLLAAHVNLIISGGIAEKAAAGVSATDRRRPETVSQADVAPFLAFITRAPLRFMAESLFTKDRGLPVYSELELGSFVPEGGNAATAAAYHRALRQYISIWSE